MRLWNMKSHEVELMKVFPEEMFSVALHPTGEVISCSDLVPTFGLLVTLD